MIGITAVALAATTAINTIVQARVFSTVIFGAVAYKCIPKPIVRKWEGIVCFLELEQ